MVMGEALLWRMSRTPNNPELHELASRLLRIGYTGPEVSRAASCHRYNGHIRVTRTIRNELLTLGITDNISIAALYSDCLTKELWGYTADMSTPIPDDALNFPSRYDELAASNPLIPVLANNVVEYLKSNEYLCDYVELVNSRRMHKKIIADFDAQLAAIRRIEEDRAKARKSLDNLYKL
jgi:hypothetical protein